MSSPEECRHQRNVVTRGMSSPPLPGNESMVQTNVIYRPLYRTTDPLQELPGDRVELNSFLATINTKKRLLDHVVVSLFLCCIDTGLCW